MEYILNSNDHKITNNCLRFNFHNPIRFINQKISLTSIIFYNYFENITDKFTMSVNYKNKLIIMTFQNGSYNISDINQIIDDTIQEKFNITEKPTTISVDVSFKLDISFKLSYYNEYKSYFRHGTVGTKACRLMTEDPIKNLH